MDLKVQLIAEGDTTQEEIANAAAAVRAELERVSGVESVREIVGTAPKGAKAIGLMEIGTFLVAAKPTIELLTAIIKFATEVLKQAGTPQVKLKITQGTIEAEFDPRKISAAEVITEARRLLAPPG